MRISTLDDPPSNLRISFTSKHRHISLLGLHVVNELTLLMFERMLSSHYADLGLVAVDQQVIKTHFQVGALGEHLQRLFDLYYQVSSWQDNHRPQPRDQPSP
jgi:hypothetical protein